MLFKISLIALIQHFHSPNNYLEFFNMLKFLYLLCINFPTYVEVWRIQT